MLHSVGCKSSRIEGLYRDGWWWKLDPDDGSLRLISPNDDEAASVRVHATGVTCITFEPGESPSGRAIVRKERTFSYNELHEAMNHAALFVAESEEWQWFIACGSDSSQATDCDNSPVDVSRHRVMSRAILRLRSMLSKK